MSSTISRPKTRSRGGTLLTDEEMLDAGLHKGGSMGPVGLPEGSSCICDIALKDTHAWAVGANEDGYHFLGAEPGRDFEPMPGLTSCCKAG